MIKEGNWEFPELGLSGSEADLVVYHHNELPEINGHQPSLPNVFTALADGHRQRLRPATRSRRSATGHDSLLKGGGLAPRGSWPKGVAPLPDFNDTSSPLHLISIDREAKRPVTETVRRAGAAGR